MNSVGSSIEDHGYDAVFSVGLTDIGLCFHGERLRRIEYLQGVALKKPGQSHVRQVQVMIERFFISPDESLLDIPCQLEVTAFQESVLQEVSGIPAGEVQTYGEIARRLKTSARAVGNACRKNPLPLIIPCHRVVAANGIGGYDGARNGRLLAIKHRLLENEGVCLRSMLR